PNHSRGGLAPTERSLVAGRDSSRRRRVTLACDATTTISVTRKSSFRTSLADNETLALLLYVMRGVAGRARQVHPHLRLRVLPDTARRTECLGSFQCHFPRALQWHRPRHAAARCARGRSPRPSRSSHVRCGALTCAFMDRPTEEDSIDVARSLICRRSRQAARAVHLPRPDRRRVVATPTELEPPAQGQ